MNKHDLVITPAIIGARNQALVLRNRLVDKGLLPELKKGEKMWCPLLEMSLRKKMRLQKRKRICFKCIFQDCVL